MIFKIKEAIMENKITKHSFLKRSVYTEIIIDAPKEKVWKVLTDFDSMPKWSTSLQGIFGDFTANGQTEVQFIMFGKLKEFNHKMIDFEEGIQFGWSDPFYFNTAKDYHIYRLESISDKQTKFIQKDEFNGILGLLLGNYATKKLLSVYQEFNQELKERVENQSV
jgi:hypothetical protein